MHLPAGLLAGFRQGLQKILPVDIVKEDIFPPVTPAQDMIDGTWILDSNLAGHGRLFLKSEGPSQTQLDFSMG
jgi:hypothetical protein